MLFRRQLDYFFQILEDVSPFIQEASSVLIGGELQAFKLCVGVSLQSR